MSLGSALERQNANQQSVGSSLTVFGHSLNYIGSNDNPVADRLAGLLHTSLSMYAIGGSTLCFGGGFGIGLGSGGWDHVYRYTASNTTLGERVPHRGPCLLWTGLNDLLIGTSGSITSTTLIPVENAFRACISRLQATQVYEENDASVTYPGGGYTRNAAGSMNAGSVNLASGAFNESTPTNAKTISIAVPATFPGGTVTAAFLVATTGAGSVWTFTVDGVAAGTIDTRNVQPIISAIGGWNPVVKRFTNLTAGAHTIVCTPSSIVTATYFDCWWIEGATQPIGVPDQYRLQAVDANKDADISVLNSVITTVVGEFGGNVFVIPTDDLILKNAAGNLLTDGVHLADYGHGVMAHRFHDYFLRAAFTRHAQAITSAIPQGLTRRPNTSARNVITPALPSISALTLKQSDQGYNYQSGDLLPVQDGNGAVLAGTGFDKNGRAKTVVGGGLRRSAGIASVAWNGTNLFSLPSAQITHGLGVGFTANTTNASNVLTVTAIDEPITADWVGRRVHQLTGTSAGIAAGSLITAVTGAGTLTGTITITANATATTTGGTYCVRPFIQVTSADGFGTFGLFFGWGVEIPSVATQTKDTFVARAYGWIATTSLAAVTVFPNTTVTYFQWVAHG